MTLNIELKQCPFCGSSSYVCQHDGPRHNAMNNPDVFSVMCSVCYSTTDDYVSMELAVESWNRRIND